MIIPHTISKIGLIMVPLAIAMSQPAMAQNEQHVQVAYADLDLNSDAGRKTLSYRIKAAVKSVCNSRTTSRGTEYINAQKCEAKAMKDAYAQIAQIKVKKTAA